MKQNILSKHFKESAFIMSKATISIFCTAHITIWNYPFTDHFNLYNYLILLH